MEMLSVQDTQTLFQCIHDLRALKNLETFSLDARSILKSLFPHICPQIKTAQPQSDLTPIDLTFDLPPQDLSDRDYLLLSLIQPHLSATYQDLQNCTRLEQDLQQIERSLQQISLIVLDLRGQVKWRTDPAIGLLEMYFTPPISTQQLPKTLQIWVQKQCDRLNRKPNVSSRSAVLGVNSPNKSDENLVIRFIQAQATNQYILQLSEEERSGLDLKSLGFPPKETEVLQGLMNGWNASRISTEMKLHIGTIRKYRSSLYKKLGVHNHTGAMGEVIKQLGYF